MNWRKTALILALLTIFGGGVATWGMLPAFPQREGKIVLPGLDSRVTVLFDRFANPTITAESKTDAYYSLGYLTARDRMFQMDMMRRKTAGRLSEVFGGKTLELDIWHRQNGFFRAAIEIVQTLPEHQKKLLQAYVRGVNAYLGTVSVLPIEFMALDYTPDRWTEEDSILISLSMFQQLNWTESDERMISVMKKALPEDVATFLMPQSDHYNSFVLLEGSREQEQAVPEIPVASLQKLMHKDKLYAAEELVDSNAVRAGSNQWVVNKTADGRAILANDMHLPLTVPNIWYQASLNYDGITIQGITLPGLPLVVAGSNGSIAWGYTNSQADVMDLAVLDKNPDNDLEYLTAEGWKPVETNTETVKVKGEEDREIKVRRTIWGPVSPRPLMGNEVAIQWTAFYPNAVNLDLAQMDRVESIDEALNLFNEAGLPVLNVMLADRNGNIAWTLTGKIPQRVNFDGSDSVTRTEDRKWNGFVISDAYPRIKNPASGFLVTANNRVLPESHSFKFGNNFANSYRAFRITELLKQGERISEDGMHRMQLDAKSEFYRFYQQLMLSVLSGEVLNQTPYLVRIKKAVERWDGHANADSIGFGILTEFRRRLANVVFSSYVRECKNLDVNFRYRWYQMDTPLRALLSQQIPETLPAGLQYDSWNDLILDALVQTSDNIERRFPDARPDLLEWGQMESFRLRHPFSRASEWLGIFLDLPEEPISGCVHCVRVSKSKFAASMRMVVSPGHEDEMILVEPTGQSGHPFSAHYRDKFHYWVKGLPLKINDDKDTISLILLPDKKTS